MRNEGILPGQLADDEKQSSEEEDPSDQESDSVREKMRLKAVMRMGKIITRMKQMMHRNKVIMNVYIPLYLFQRAVKVSGLKFLIISIYLPPSLASNLNI